MEEQFRLSTQLEKKKLEVNNLRKLQKIEQNFENLSFEQLKVLQWKNQLEAQKIEKAMTRAMEQEIEKIKIQVECIVCMDRKCQVLCLPCGHYVSGKNLILW